MTGRVKFRFTATSGANAVVSGLFFSAPLAPASAASATFLKTDTTTLGNWQGTYGNDGYSVAGDLSVNSSYAAPALSGQLTYSWAGSTADVRALQKASSPTERIASTWFSDSSMLIDTNISDQTPHQVALYCIDWDSTARRETVDVLDMGGNVLDSQSLIGFNGGVYLVWNVAGHVRFRLNRTAGANSVVSGIFFR